MKHARLRNAFPSAQRALVTEPELGEHIGDMEFHRVAADAELCGDTLVGEPVTDEYDDPPLGGGQDVVMGRASASRGHRSGD